MRDTLFNVVCPLTGQMSCDRNDFAAGQSPDDATSAEDRENTPSCDARAAVCCAWTAGAFHVHLCSGPRVLISLSGLIQSPVLQSVHLKYRALPARRLGATNRPLSAR